MQSVDGIVFVVDSSDTDRFGVRTRLRRFDAWLTALLVCRKCAKS
jgi:hypothetical protein